MNSSHQVNTADRALRAVKLAFIAAHERGEPLHIWLERYPQHARTLIDLALSLDMAPHQPDPSEERVAMSMSAVRRALKEGPSPPQREAALGLVARSRASGITIPQLARRTRLKSDILFKLDRGVLQLETVPKRLLAQLAEALVCPVDALTASLPTSPMTVTAMYYADQAPDVARQQSFAEALAQSDELPEDDRLHWLAVVREEGLSM